MASAEVVVEQKHATMSDTQQSTTQSVEANDKSTNECEPEYPGAFQLTLISLAMGFSIFISGLVSVPAPSLPIFARTQELTSVQDNTIIGTATPTITNEFQTLSDIGWYGSSCMSGRPSDSDS